MLSSQLTAACNKLETVQGTSPVLACTGSAWSHVASAAGPASGVSVLQESDVSALSGQPEASVDRGTSHRNTTKASQRKSNLVLFGLEESDKGTQRHVRTRHDIEFAGELLTWLDPLVTCSQVVDVVRLGKYSVGISRPLLVTLTRPSDVQSVFLARRKLATRPGIGVKPDLSAEERKVESLLLKERRVLIDSGADRSTIRLHSDTIFVRKQKHGTIVNGEFKKCNGLCASNRSLYMHRCLVLTIWVTKPHQRWRLRQFRRPPALSVCRRHSPPTMYPPLQSFWM